MQQDKQTCTRCALNCKLLAAICMLQAVMSMFHDLGFVSRHHIIPDRLARYVA